MCWLYIRQNFHLLASLHLSVDAIITATHWPPLSSSTATAVSTALQVVCQCYYAIAMAAVVLFVGVFLFFSFFSINRCKSGMQSVQYSAAQRAAGMRLGNTVTVGGLQ